MTIKDQTVKFIKANLNLLDEYDLRPIYSQLIKARFKRDTGFSLTCDHWGVASIESLGFKSQDWEDYKQLLSTFKQWQKANNLRGMDCKLKYEFKTLHRWYHIRILDQEQCVFSVGDDALPCLFTLFIYLRTGEIPVDYAEANQISDDTFKRQWPKPESYRDLPLVGLQGLTLSRFKNGKHILKGLTPEQWQEFKRVVSIIQKPDSALVTKE